MQKRLLKQIFIPKWTHHLWLCEYILYAVHIIAVASDLTCYFTVFQAKYLWVDNYDTYLALYAMKKSERNVFMRILLF